VVSGWSDSGWYKVSGEAAMIGDLHGDAAAAMVIYSPIANSNKVVNII